MSYSIIFQTKIVKLPDGRIIHFDRSGCNNDNAGRSKSEFTAKIYDTEDFIKLVEHFKEGSKPYKESSCFDLKIGSRYATYYDYAEHLLRMFKRAEKYDEFIKNHHFRASYCKAIHLIEPEEKVMTLEEFNKVFYKFFYNGRLEYFRIMEHPNEMNDIVKCIEDGKHMEFYID